MSGFSADWLELHAACDARSRSAELVRTLRERLPARPLHAIDLGAGTASNIRYLAPRLGGRQCWLAVENDPALVARQPTLLQGPDHDCRVSARRLDLSADLSELPFSECALVTA